MVIDLARVPVLDEAWKLAAEGIVPGGTALSGYGGAVCFECGLSTDRQLVLSDPHPDLRRRADGGGAHSAELVLAYLRKSNRLAADVIGRVVPADGASSVRFKSSRQAWA